MKTIALTGGIACGKSTVVNILKAIDNGTIEYFDFDRNAHLLLDSGKIADPLVSLFGSEAVLPDGKANRPFIRSIVFHDHAAKRELEGIIHPILKQECLALWTQTRQNNAKNAFIIDVPLFYETGERYKHDLVCVIGASVGTQIKRLAERNGFSCDFAEKIIHSQMAVSAKIALADISIWNECSMDILQ